MITNKLVISDQSIIALADEWSGAKTKHVATARIGISEAVCEIQDA